MCKRLYPEALLVWMGTDRPQPLCDLGFEDVILFVLGDLFVFTLLTSTVPATLMF